MQQQKVQMSKKQFRIGDLAEELKVKKFVIRFWEKEFGIESDRSEGGQRFYTSDDLKTFLMIKDLLYNKGFTIAGAKKQLETSRGVNTGASVVVAVEESVQEPATVASTVRESMVENQEIPEHEEIVAAVSDQPEQEELLVAATVEVEQSIQPATEEVAEVVTPATKEEACLCQDVFAQLQTFKSQLLMFKDQLSK